MQESELIITKNTSIKSAMPGLMWVCYSALIIQFTIAQFLNPNGFNLTIWFIQCLPLLALLPGMLTKYRRSYLWLCFVILLYFVKAVDGIMGQQADWGDTLFLALTVLLFISAMMTARWHQVNQRRE